MITIPILRFPFFLHIISNQALFEEIHPSAVNGVKLLTHEGWGASWDRKIAPQMTTAVYISVKYPLGVVFSDAL